MRPSGLPVLLEVNNVWDSSLITCDPLLKLARWRQGPGSGQHGGRVDSGLLSLTCWPLICMWFVFLHFSFWAQCWGNLVCHSRWQSLFMPLPLSQEFVMWLCAEHTDCVMLWRQCWFSVVLSDSLFLSCFAHSDASVPSPDALLTFEVRVILTWRSFNWQIEWISLTTSLSSHGTLLYLTQWVELTCHLCGQPANSDSVSFSHPQVQLCLHKLYLSSSLCIPPLPHSLSYTFLSM